MRIPNHGDTVILLKLYSDSANMWQIINLKNPMQHACEHRGN